FSQPELGSLCDARRSRHHPARRKFAFIRLGPARLHWRGADADGGRDRLPATAAALARTQSCRCHAALDQQPALPRAGDAAAAARVARLTFMNLSDAPDDERNLRVEVPG